ncbi:hypothetical protein GGI07_000722 [Coemansia sp. Benny D115]|nr:hypothetical protein GGI07_000722 [Coemansia sp. Benny D115]
MTTIHATHVQQLGSADPGEVYTALRSIKNNVIGSSAKKALYVRLQVVPAVTALLLSNETSIESRTQATVIVSSLARAHGEEVAEALAGSGVVDALIHQMAGPQAAQDTRLVEASARALNALLEHSAALSAIADEAALVAQALEIINSTDTKSALGMHGHACAEVAVLIVARLCVSEAGQYLVANTGVIDALVRLLLAEHAHMRLQAAALQALGALSYENAEICAALGAARNGDVARAVLRLVRAQDTTLRLHACEVAANLGRMRAVAARDVQAVAVPALVKLISTGSTRAVQALGYLCHEDADGQAAAKAAGAIDALLQRLAAAWELGEGDFADPQRSAVEARAAFLALGTVVSTNEECRRSAVDAGIFGHIVRALTHKDASVRAAACLCARYIVRSVAICRTNVPESGILRPLLALLDDTDVDVQATAAATLVNLLTDFSPLRTDALKLGLLDKLAALLDSPQAAVRKNALWAVRNLLFGAEDDTRREIIAHVGADRLLALAQPDTPADAPLQEHAVGALRNVVADSRVGIDAVFTAAGGNAAMVELLTKLIQPTNDRAVLVHALYLVNNIAVRAPERCAAIVEHRPLLQAIVQHVASSASEVAIAALWCISSITSHETMVGGTSQSIHAMVLHNLGVSGMLQRLLADPAVPMDVRDRVKGCVDSFPMDYPRPSSF